MALIDLFRPRPTIVRHVRVTTASVLGKSVEELYRTQPALRAVVGFLADNVGSLPLKVYDRVGDTDRPRVTDGVAPELLARPNAHTSPQQLWNGVAFDVLLYGSSLVYVAPSADAPCGWEMTRIPWSWVADELTEDGLYPTAYKVRNPDSGRGEVTLAASSCVLFRTYDPLGPNHTSSPVDALRQVLAEQISAWNFRNGVWKNGGRVSQVLTRPLNAEWSPEARKRFAKSWKERFSGEEGTNTGGTPLLEDGMKLESVQFNAREAQWQEATRLTREDVAAVYHVNPALVWHTDGQTYASAKDNARALYADTLAPFLNMVEGVINSFLLPMIGAPSTQYAEFDIEAKLAGSFEERASVLQSSVGGPWITRNEARAKLNMSAVEGGDELIVPLNVTEGGLASPNDTDPTVARNAIDAIARKVAGFLAAQREPSAGVMLPAPKAAVPPTPGNEGHGRVGDRVQGQAEPVVTLKSRAEAPDASTAAIEECLVRFLERQSRRVLNDLAGKSRRPSGKDGGEGDGEYPFWWDAARWNRELADDLEPIFRTLCDLRGTAAMADIGEPAESWDSSRTANFVRAMAERRADLFNETTYEELAAALMEFDEGDPRRITAAERAFLSNAENRAVRGARTFGTAVAGFATKEAVRQRYPRDTDRIRRTKTWRHHSSKTPRSSHAAMDGETVGLDDVFSNGADYPGDLSLSAKDAVNCHCTMEVRVEKVADFNVVRDGRVRYEGTTTEDDLPEGSMEAIASYIDDLNSRYTALADADGTIPYGLACITVCDTATMAEEAGLPIEEVLDASGMFVRTADGAANAGIYLNAELLANTSVEQVLSDFRHEYGHYVGWFIGQNGPIGDEDIANAAIDEFLQDSVDASRETFSTLIADDLSAYAGDCWFDGNLREVFAEAFRVWQEGGESQLAAIIGPTIDFVLKGLA